MTKTGTGRVTIRTNYGSHRVVARVYWYDAGRGSVSVRFADGTADQIEVSELEALRDDPARTFADLDHELRKRCQRDGGDIYG